MSELTISHICSQCDEQSNPEAIVKEHLERCHVSQFSQGSESTLCTIWDKVSENGQSPPSFHICDQCEHQSAEKQILHYHMETKQEAVSQSEPTDEMSKNRES